MPTCVSVPSRPLVSFSSPWSPGPGTKQTVKASPKLGVKIKTIWNYHPGIHDVLIRTLRLWHIFHAKFFWMLLTSVFYDTYIKLPLPHHDCCSPVNQVPTDGLSRKSPSSFFSSFQWSKQFTTWRYIPQRSSPHDVINISRRWEMLLIVWE